MFIIVPPGFGGRGVLPGVAIGSNLNPKSSKNFFTGTFEVQNKSSEMKTKVFKLISAHPYLIVDFDMWMNHFIFVIQFQGEDKGPKEVTFF